MSAHFRCSVSQRLQISAVVFCRGFTGNKERAPFDEIARKLLSGRIGGCVSTSTATARARASLRRRPHSTRCRAQFLILPGQAVSPMGPALIVHGWTTALCSTLIEIVYISRGTDTSWYCLPGENHNFTQEADNAADTIAKWFKCILKRGNSRRHTLLTY